MQVENVRNFLHRVPNHKKLAINEPKPQNINMSRQHITQISSIKVSEAIHFHRTELGPIMSLYGRMVAAGEWRDYGISALHEVAIFSIFRRTAEHALYRIEKRPKQRDKQGMFCIICMDGRILKRGNDLTTVLRILERKLIRTVN